jgi:hypothetical protein
MAGDLWIFCLRQAEVLEILLLLNHADGHKLTRDQVTALCKNNTAAAVKTALNPYRLLTTNEIRSTPTPGEIALTPKGQKRIIEKSFRHRRFKRPLRFPDTCRGQRCAG